MHLKSLDDNTLKRLDDNTVKRLDDRTLKRLGSILELTTRCISVHAEHLSACRASKCMQTHSTALLPLGRSHLDAAFPTTRIKVDHEESLDST